MIFFAEQLQQNFRILVEMNANHIDDILPLVCVEKTKLEQFSKILQELDDPAENPIYYFSAKLQVN